MNDRNGLTVNEAEAGLEELNSIDNTKGVSGLEREKKGNYENGFVRFQRRGRAMSGKAKRSRVCNYISMVNKHIVFAPAWLLKYHARLTQTGILASKRRRELIFVLTRMLLSLYVYILSVDEQS